MQPIQRRASNLVCLTGGIGTGKTRVQQALAARGWATICTDDIVHRFYEKDQPLPQEIAQLFGPSVLTPEGGVDRKALGKRVFGDPMALQQLNQLVHPKVRAQWKALAAESFRAGKKTIVVIPLAFETQVEKEFSQIWVVACSPMEQKERLRKRGYDDVEIEKRLATQWPLQKKIDLADFIIWNNGPWSVTEEQLKNLPL